MYAQNLAVHLECELSSPKYDLALAFLECVETSSVMETEDMTLTRVNLKKMWSTGEGNGKPLQYSCLENPMNTMRRQNDRILKEELPRSVGAQYATGDQWRNNSRKNEGMEPKQK